MFFLRPLRGCPAVRVSTSDGWVLACTCAGGLARVLRRHVTGIPIASAPCRFRPLMKRPPVKCHAKTLGQSASQSQSQSPATVARAVAMAREPGRMPWLRSFVVVSLNGRSAYDCMSRAAFLKKLRQVAPELLPFVGLFSWPDVHVREGAAATYGRPTVASKVTHSPRHCSRLDNTTLRPRPCTLMTASSPFWTTCTS